MGFFAGVLTLMSKSRRDKFERVLAARQPDLTVFLDNVHKPRNISAILRTCDAIGIGRLHAYWPEERLRLFAGTAASSQKWVSVLREPNRRDALLRLKHQGYQLLAAHFSPRAVDFRAIDYLKPTVVILGAEKDGVSAESAELADAEVIIPMCGVVPSLNVSVAAATILYEAQRQRQAAGRYQPCELSEEQRKQLFEWLQPELSQYCRERSLPYPELDADGDLVTAPGR